MFPWLQIYLKGMLMGVADIVPGVSGGTIAFITGIYQRLIDAIAVALPSFIRMCRTRDLKQFSEDVDLFFLLTLLGGILSSVVLFAGLIHSALSSYPVLLWAFFFGLIVASIFLVRTEMRRFAIPETFAMLTAAVLAWWLTASELPALPSSVWGAFLSGVIAICAMILPGISGSLLLLLLGTYGFVLGAVKSFDLSILAVFCAGCVCGLLGSARVLRYCLNRYHDVTIAALLGLMIGALNKVWPWKITTSYRENSRGEQVPYIQENVLPAVYEATLGIDAELWVALLCFAVGVICVVTVGRLASLKQG